jgi:hypothetical protein
MVYALTVKIKGSCTPKAVTARHQPHHNQALQPNLHSFDRKLPTLFREDEIGRLEAARGLME